MIGNYKKNEILKLEEDQNNDYQSIIKQIKESKNKTRKLQKTLDDHEKDVKQQQKDRLRESTPGGSDEGKNVCKA